MYNPTCQSKFTLGDSKMAMKKAAKRSAKKAAKKATKKASKKSSPNKRRKAKSSGGPGH
jgi:hypothetical protein